MRPSVEEEVAALATLSPAQVRERSMQVTGEVVPKVSPSLLRLALAYELQAKTYGGLSRKTKQRLAQVAAAKTQTRDVRPGMRLVREWNGTIHVVPAFFGLKRKVPA